MKLTIRKIKRAWAYCDTNEEHGKTQFELTIQPNHAQTIKVWLCQNCIAEISSQINTEITRIWSELNKDER
jgi:hypothetical protein